MFKRLLHFLTGTPDAPPAAAPAKPRPVADPAPAVEPAPAAATGLAPEAVSTPAEMRGDDGGALLARADVLDRGRALNGFVFSLHESAAGKVRARTRRSREFLDELKVGTLLGGAVRLLRSRTGYIPVWDGFLPNPMLERLAPTGSVLILQPERLDAAPDPALVRRAAELRDAGLRIALDDHSESPWFDGFAQVADHFVLDSARRSPEELRQLGSRLVRVAPNVNWLAWNVATEEDFEHLHRLGCEAFHGGFVTHREDWQGHRLQPHSMRVAMLLNRLREDTETRELAAVLKHDVALTYRLLRYVNAAAWGINNPITSIEHALVVLGRMPLRRWLALLLFGSARKDGGSNALMEVALTRARFMELLGADRVGKDECEQLFMTGLFSLLDVIMRVPLPDALKPVKVPDTVSDALLRREGPWLPYLQIAEALELGQADVVEEAATGLGLTMDDINRRQIDALLWVQASSESPEEVSTPAR
ncbi:MAG: HDOD domain-containing protein [Rhodocyclaceae bacterium]|nr:HDOD domain-containing protein [Rhodocyclaceae bacterium]